MVHVTKDQPQTRALNSESSPEATTALESSARDLVRWLSSKTSWFVLTGAGVSTASGIPAYRDAEGVWRHKRPMTYQEFIGSGQAQRRYWARTVTGYRRVRDAEPNAAHHALAQLEKLGLVRLIVTQNVDGLHLRAGSQRVVELHGRLRDVKCLACESAYSRDEINTVFETLNQGRFPSLDAQHQAGPDGDALLEGDWVNELEVPVCPRCSGVLKPDVVFFGENVPSRVVEQAYQALEQSQGLLVVGSSLTVFSGFRFVRRAAKLGLPIVIVNQGRTRADELASARFDAPCASLLPAALECFGPG